ncbi:hypothetical protein CDL12_01629 [Handroanthus impetiginosus]|uniref:Uncharacterized protein n=1 Tax=Handroanthus impetiginosus TaxID=429701 RepID=A0A2G9I7A1_9LAMI|nr:hypothetical protein CDL12_01629 [Handroanthus impetiginosus]
MVLNFLTEVFAVNFMLAEFHLQQSDLCRQIPLYCSNQREVRLLQEHSTMHGQTIAAFLKNTRTSKS